MGKFAWRNLLTRPLRTALALIGLSIPILGVLGLFSLSSGLRQMVGDTLSQVEGLMVLDENAPSPVFSTLPAKFAEDLKRTPGVRVVAPEVWHIAPSIEGQGLMSKLGAGLMSNKGMQSILDQPVVQGQEFEGHHQVRSAVFPRALREKGEGRYLTAEDKGQPHIVISRKLAKAHPRDAQGTPRSVGDTLNIGGKPFKIIGIYETGSMLLDVVIVMDIETARKLLGVSDDQVSSFYVEATDPTLNDAVAQRIEKAHPEVDARSMIEFMANFGSLLSQVDTFLLMTVSLALVVGVVGIINTMLMSTTERFVEFGVLRTNGWSQGDLLRLVTLESAYLGLLAGLVGSVLAWGGSAVANQFLTNQGVHLEVAPVTLLVGIGLSVITGTLGGLYPAWRAARLVPMDAIRLGSH